ncbi:hypothetical protein [Bradyrhizobium diazoefficiens]|uniref:hypothetical protein n=1 Tax=Bradyrhizobium diazoefficiens TaxID=1355477 RepID=UPI001FEE12CE|nr:hypothetical protein [Bradyrhizobium diazoefficiens]
MARPKPGAKVTDSGQRICDRAVALQRQRGAALDHRRIEIGVDARQCLGSATDFDPAAPCIEPANSVEPLVMLSLWEPSCTTPLELPASVVMNESSGGEVKPECRTSHSP